MLHNVLTHMALFRSLRRGASLMAVCAGLAVALCGCSSDMDFPSPEPADGDRLPDVYLTLSVNVAETGGTNARSRAGEEEPPYTFEPTEIRWEMMNTLRVIITRPSGGTQIIEHNKRFTLPEPGTTWFSTVANKLDFPVRGGEYKTLYLIANEDATGYTDALDALKEGDEYNPLGDGAIENMIITAAQSTVPGNDDTNLCLIDNRKEQGLSYVPMSEKYTFFLPDAQNYQPEADGHRYASAGRLFVTRAAVKFSFNITAEHCEGIFLKRISFNSLADKEYLLPRNTRYSPEKMVPDMLNPVENPTMNRIVTSYTIPQNATHALFEFPLSVDSNMPNGPELSTGTTTLAPEFYFCESGTISTNGSPYSVSITLAYQETVKVVNEDGEAKWEEVWKEDPFEIEFLDNLPSLPRNTHVKVNISFRDRVIDAKVVLVPYIGVDLTPSFGF